MHQDLAELDLPEQGIRVQIRTWRALLDRPLTSYYLVLGITLLLLGLSVVGLCLTLIHGVGVTQNGASRWINIGGQQVQPSEIAKLALAMWGADLLARKDRFGQLADWRHMLVPLMPGAGVLCLLVMSGDGLGTTFILLVIFLALLWVIGTPGRVYSGVLILMGLAMVLMIVSAQYPFQRLTGYP